VGPVHPDRVDLRHGGHQGERGEDEENHAAPDLHRAMGLLNRMTGYLDKQQHR
jgi:hypothetical protein